MSATRNVLWLGAGAVVGGLTYAAVTHLGLGLVKENALPMGVIGGLFVYGLRFTRLLPPMDDASRRRAVLTRSARNRLRLFFGLLTIGAVAYAAQEARQGYPLLAPDRVLMGTEPVPLTFYTLEGKVLPESSYKMQDKSRQVVLVPLDRYEGRVLAMLDEAPPNKTIRITGRLRTDVRTVQTDEEGRVQGPFARIYRERMGLPDGAQLYYLDTGMRAGLNIWTILMVLFPAYLFLLSQGAAVQLRRYKMRPRHR